MDFSVATSLPTSLIESLESKGAKVLRECADVPIIDLASKEAVDMYIHFLCGDEEVDPLVGATFGPIANPYISAAAQAEVWTIIATYQTKMPVDFAPGAPAIVLNAPVVAVPMGGGFQYHHAQIALHKVQARIENPNGLAGLPLLSAMNSADTICDLNIVYANCVVSRRIRKL